MPETKKTAPGTDGEKKHGSHNTGTQKNSQGTKEGKETEIKTLKNTQASRHAASPKKPHNQKVASQKPEQQEKLPKKPRNGALHKPKKTQSEAVPSQQKKTAPQSEAQQPAKTQKRRPSRSGGGNKKNQEQRKPTVRIIPLGGLHEIGKNITVYECGEDMLVVDCGLAFPDETMLGVDLVIPDFTFLEKNQDRIRGVFLTHGHEDHIGALPFLLKQMNVPLYGTRLTLGLVEGKLKEHGLLGKVSLNVVQPRDVVKAGCMSVEFIRVNHSIPDACSLAINTPAGVIIQTGDFKVDYTPIEGGIIDLARFGELGGQGVLAVLPDSTNVEQPGSSVSERVVGASFDTLFKRAANKRIIIATFSSNIHRIQQIIDNSYKFGKKVAVSGRSMVNVVNIALELGYLTIPEGVLIDIDTIKKYPDDQIVIITTGSQGEPMSALTRMSMSDHRKVSVSLNDFIIISAKPIPGNEKLVNRVVNELMKLGAEVVYEKMYEVHVSGHACQDEIKLMLALTKPKFVIPVHGEYKHLKKNKYLATSLGIDPNNIFIGDNGKVIETDGVDMKFAGTVTAGRVFVDGLGVGDVGSIVLRDRKHLAQDGLIVVVATIDSVTGEMIAGPDIVSRGFVYVREAEEMMKQAKVVATKIFEDCMQTGTKDWASIKLKVRDEMSRFLYGKTKRSPMILPVIQEI